MDLMAIGNEIGSYLPNSQSLIVIALFSIGIALVYLTQSGKKLRARLSETVFSNWQLALLGTTGIILSLASGWTTWDGMRNFTQEPLLSLMITFGIQGVMLIVAWLIGESFATGMNFRPDIGDDNAARSKRTLRAMQPLVGTVIGLLLFGAVALLILNRAGVGSIASNDLANGGWAFLPDSLLLAAVAILLVAAIVLNAGSDILGDYLQAVRVMVRSAVLWVMFLACMATSVFFSFDSLFSAIFPQKERVRAAELRAQNQIAGVVNDVGGLTARRRLEERDRLFETEGWKQYDGTLDRLVLEARKAPDALQQHFEKKMRDRQKVVAQRQEEKASAEGQQVRLSQRVKVLNDEISRSRAEISQLTPTVEQLKTQIFAKDREVVAKRAEAEAEAGGIGVTAKIGRGPKFREISAELRTLREQKKNLELQLREYEKRLGSARKVLSSSESELSTVQGDLATLKGRADTAAKLIELAQASNNDEGQEFDPTNGLRQLERARVAFRQDPSHAGLVNIQRLCATLLGAMSDVPTLKSSALGVDCDPGQANEAAERVFALNSGIKVLAANCIGGDKLPKSGGADALFQFARQCVQDAGLPSKDTNELRTQINYLELNRDDKAHRFVVTSNAFEDGNKLAYLALAIAIAIDALVFMSGLFGANAVRSPLSDVPSHKGRSALQLEAIIDNALQPHPYDTARLVLGNLHPITPQAGFTAEIVVEDGDPHAADLRRVLNAGSSIGAVRHRDDRDRVYQVRSELFEYLSIAAKREYERDKKHTSLAELERTVSVALLPDVAQNAETVLSYMHPIVEDRGFMAEVRLSEFTDDDQLRTMRSALNAGAVYDRVQRDNDSPDRYFIHGDFFKTLTMLRGRLLMSSASAAPALSDQRGARDGGALLSDPAEAVGSDATQKRLATTSGRPRSASHSNVLQPPQRDRDQFMASFLTSLDVQPRSYMELGGEAFRAAVAASESFSVFCQHHPELHSPVASRSRSMEDQLHNQIRELEAGITANDSPELIELDAAIQDLKSNWGIIMLLPGGPYEMLLKDIVEQLEQERGAGQLNTADRPLLQAARYVAQAMDSNPRQSTADWSNLGGALQIVEGDHGKVSQFPNIITKRG